MSLPVIGKHGIAAAPLASAFISPQLRRLGRKGDGVDAIVGKCFSSPVHTSTYPCRPRDLPTSSVIKKP